jgi:hypothetical protein
MVISGIGLSEETEAARLSEVARLSEAANDGSRSGFRALGKSQRLSNVVAVGAGYLLKGSCCLNHR